MKNFIQPGFQLDMIAPADVLSGEGVLIGTIFGIAAQDAASGAPVTLSTAGVFEMPKASADNITAGAALYWDAAEKEMTLDDAEGANPKVGAAVQAAAAATLTVRVRLNGFI